MNSFGDRVRILESPETIAAGVAGMEGSIYGWTTPSLSGVSVVGGAPDDYALNVNISLTGQNLWFRPDLVELLHHNAGFEIVVKNKKAIRQANDSWVEMENDLDPESARAELFGLYEKRKKGNRLYAVLPALVAFTFFLIFIFEDPDTPHRDKTPAVICLMILASIGLALGIVPAPFPENARIKYLEGYFRKLKSANNLEHARRDSQGNKTK